MFKSGISFFLAGILGISTAFASTEDIFSRSDDSASQQLFSNEVLSTSNLGPEDAFLRSLAVLRYYAVPDEPDSLPFFEDLQGKPTLSHIRRVLPFLDPGKNFQNFGRLSHSDGNQTELDVYQDWKSALHPDYFVSLKSESRGLSDDGEVFHQHLLKASKNPDGLPLAGLRIALDPGHMGGEVWDNRTGKYVHDENGHKLSEGVMALQISLLLEKSLTDLGAEVFLTRRGLTPVSHLKYESYDLYHFALKALQESTFLPWYQSLLRTAPASQLLFDAFDRSKGLNQLFSESQRARYFILGADLTARVDTINAVSPDISLVIHLDTVEPTSGDSNGLYGPGHDGTKAYVQGAFALSELASREDRKFFGRHLMDAQAWNASVQLSRQITSQIHSQMGVPYDSVDTSNSAGVEPGVQARNLAVQRRLTSQASSYVECLFYNDPKEFAALLKRTHPMEIDGISYPYSDRLAQIAQSIQDGLVGFVRGYHE